MQCKLPHAPTEHGQRSHHHGYTHPSRIGFLPGATTISAYIFGKLGPVAVCTGCAALPEAGFKPLHPRGFFQFECAQIASNDPFAEHAAGQGSVISCFQRVKMA